MTARELIASMYDDFNARRLDTLIAAMQPDVVWANGMDGGYVHGHEGVREYWTRQWSLIDPHVEPLHMHEIEDGLVRVLVHQVVRDLSGNVLADLQVRHEFQLRDGLIERFEIR